eukprot:CAMPEP_0194535728 /NCGR_PEP_ID=MMETSP0253-20130528/74352_1 /TAXON_ID=2966 /ORGANISM="Noctiluca scintillans" /LENGTH=60 /DNA_ID=CAMNT_0039381543 /DNA_START=285 /DNA_END=467 /DNA_ORIENTATION=-
MRAEFKVLETVCSRNTGSCPNIQDRTPRCELTKVASSHRTPALQLSNQGGKLLLRVLELQ